MRTWSRRSRSRDTRRRPLEGAPCPLCDPVARVQAQRAVDGPLGAQELDSAVLPVKSGNTSLSGARQRGKSTAVREGPQRPGRLGLGACDRARGWVLHATHSVNAAWRSRRPGAVEARRARGCSLAVAKSGRARRVKAAVECASTESRVSWKAAGL